MSRALRRTSRAGTTRLSFTTPPFWKKTVLLAFRSGLKQSLTSESSVKPFRSMMSGIVSFARRIALEAAWGQEYPASLLACVNVLPAAIVCTSLFRRGLICFFGCFPRLKRAPLLHVIARAWNTPPIKAGTPHISIANYFGVQLGFLGPIGVQNPQFFGVLPND